MGVITLPKYDLARLEKFLDDRRNEIHREYMANETFIDSAYNSVKDGLPKQGKALDVGCGHGYALDVLKNHGLTPVGITLFDDDYVRATARGHEVHYMDMSFLDFEPETFDVVWARQCIEHSIMPFFTLHEINRVLKMGGFLYIEVPAPNTVGINELDPNHYSVFGSKMWYVLLNKSGFNVVKSYSIKFENERNGVRGEDESYSMLCQKAI